MDKPRCADTAPKKVALKGGQSYFFCVCGYSEQQPFCDGRHKDTPFQPMNFRPESDGDAYLCQCKTSANLPYCDGSHKHCTKSD